VIHRRAATWLTVATMAAMVLPGSVTAGEGGSGYSAGERERLGQVLRAASVAGHVERLRQVQPGVGAVAPETWTAGPFRQQGGYGSKAWASLVGAAAQVGVDQAPVVGSFLVMGHEEATEHGVREDVAAGAGRRARVPREWVEDRADRHFDDRRSASRRPARPAPPRPQPGPFPLRDPSPDAAPAGSIPLAGFGQCQVDPTSGATACFRMDGRGGAQTEVFDGQGRKLYDHRVPGASPLPMPRYGVPGPPAQPARPGPGSPPAP
jgi:hypothetical protein